MRQPLTARHAAPAIVAALCCQVSCHTVRHFRECSRFLARSRPALDHMGGPGCEPGACRLRMSPDRWMSPRATRHRTLQRWPDGMRNCTLPREGTSGASHSLTPTAATAFLLDLRSHPGPLPPGLKSRGYCRRSYEHSTPQSSGRDSARWAYRPARGGSATTRSSAPWGLHAMRYPLHSRLNHWPANRHRPAVRRASTAG